MSAYMLQRAAAIRAALMRGEDDEMIAARLGTTVQAVRVGRHGIFHRRPPAGSPSGPAERRARTSGGRPSPANADAPGPVGDGGVPMARALRVD